MTSCFCESEVAPKSNMNVWKCFCKTQNFPWKDIICYELKFIKSSEKLAFFLKQNTLCIGNTLRMQKKRFKIIFILGKNVSILINIFKNPYFSMYL